MSSTATAMAVPTQRRSPAHTTVVPSRARHRKAVSVIELNREPMASATTCTGRHCSGNHGLSMTGLIDLTALVAGMGGVR